MKIINVVGARPNFVKISPLIEEMNKFSQIEPIIVHTGQHYDYSMSKQFFQDLNIPDPDIHLEIGSGSHAIQTAKIMMGFEKVLLQEKPDLTLVVGDVNSTIACALVSTKMHIPVAHVEAGLRSEDKGMPEEINRILTDAISDYLFVSEVSGINNLLHEGVPTKKMFFVGNVMIDTLLKYKRQAEETNVLKNLGLESNDYCLLTLHRPSNVDDRDGLKNILGALEEIQRNILVIFPVHPRTRTKIQGFEMQGWIDQMKGLRLIHPVSYLEFLGLMSKAQFVLTDSGGIQEETTVLGIPCLTLRENTERPVTVEIGTNIVIGIDQKRILEESKKLINGDKKQGAIPKYWDGNAAGRIVEILLREISNEAC
ncbi:MAG: UDP-N-acetylglucosamine 2-epimerase (non-hydrolyzing) [bacterium]|nr:UDP-N-acetylglucosamine 2-epimerase (non-hydrolyzing) [bacterium]